MCNSKPRFIQPKDLLLIKTVADVQLSPNGKYVAFTLTEIGAENDDYRTNIWLASTEGGELVQLTHGPEQNTAPRWSPNGLWLAFLSNRDGEPTQLYIMPSDGGEARRLTSLEYGAGPAVWSPDSRCILFAARVSKEKPPADQGEHARWNHRPKVVTKAQYKVDGQGYSLDTCSHLFVVSIEDGKLQQLTYGDSDNRAPVWSPDGRQIAFSRSRNGARDFNESDIWVVDADGGNLRQITTDVPHATSPSWSPDGTFIAFYGTDEHELGLEESLVRVWVVPVSGGAPQPVTAGYDRGVVMLPRPAVTPGPVWSSDSTTLTFSAADRGNIHIVRVSIADRIVHPVVTGERQITRFSAVPSVGQIAFCATDPHNPSDVYVCAWDGSNERRLTWVNESVLGQLNMPCIERRRFNTANGKAIEGWLMRPMASNGPLPLLVDIHGGPHGFVGNYFSLSHFYRYILASRGWAVLTLNASGSGSYGKEFAHSIRGRWGEYDMPEQITAIDTLVGEGIADGDHLAVAGYSYGGYMAAWMICHTDRFKAAVVGAPITNLESFHGTSDIGMWYSTWEMNGDIMANRETFRRLSPVNYVDRITTPTLILHGEADDRCPIGQGEELYIGLLAVGRVPVEFVRYPGSSHLFLSNGRPSHRVDYARRVVEWVEHYTLSGTSVAPMMVGDAQWGSAVHRKGELK